MQHGRFLWRCRSMLGWTLFVLLLAGMVAVLEAVLPPQPRWTLSESMFAHGITPEGRAVITTKLKLIARGDDSLPPLQAWDLATGQELARLFPTSFDIAYKIVIPQDGADALIHVQPLEGAPWEIHLLNTTALTTRRLPIPVPSAETHMIQRIAKAPLALVAPTVYDEKKPAAQTLIDLESGAIVEAGLPDQYLTPFIFNEPMLFFGNRAGNETELTFRDRREAKAKTIRLGQATLDVSGDERRAVTVHEKKQGQQLVKLWDLATGKILTETVTEEGNVYLSTDGVWAMIQPADHVATRPPLPDATDHGHRAAFWNLAESRRVGSCPWRYVDTFEVRSIDGKPRLLTFANMKSEVCLRDLETLQPLWTRTWPQLDHLDRRHGAAKSMIGYVAFSNDLEMLDLSTGEMRRRIPLAGPRYRASPGGMPPIPFLAAVSADGRFAVLGTQFFENETGPADAWFALVRKLLGMRGRSSELLQYSVIELATAKLLLQTRDYSQGGIQNVHLSPDGKTLLVNSRTDGRNCRLECWDVPAPKPWSWILGIPLAFGVSISLARQAWQRWRRRRADAALAALRGGQERADGVK